MSSENTRSENPTFNTRNSIDEDQHAGDSIARSSSNLVQVSPSIPRNQSSEFEDPFLLYQKSLENHLRHLQREVATLKKKVHVFEDETNRNSWGIRYSRRMAVISNFLLGLWIFWSRFSAHFQKQKKGRLLGVIMVPGLKRQNSLKKLLYEAFIDAVSKSCVFIFGSLLLTRGATWKRYIGLGITTLYSLHLAIFTHMLPWTNYFNVFSNLLYITAAWTFSTPAPNSADDFIMELPPLPRLPSGDFNNALYRNTSTSQQETNNQSSK